jgi:hypothetical protein
MLTRITRVASQEMVQAAQLFYTSEDRTANDKNNKIREQFLATVLDTEHHDPKFTMVKTKWQEFLLSLSPSTQTEVSNMSNIPKILPLAGRNHNHDFAVCFPSTTFAVEFKHNAKSIKGIPQFLSLPTKRANFMSVDYANFYYDAYLHKYISADISLMNPPLPDKETYLKTVFNCNYDAHPFYRLAKSRDTLECNKLAKDKIVKASITDYLQSFGETVDMEKLTNLFLNTQSGKVFALWDPATETFYKEILTTNDLTITSIGPIKNGNTLIAKSATKEFHLLLRWKNHSGVLYPAFQIAMR